MLPGCLSTSTPSLEERAQDLERSLMCPICEGQTIYESQSALAVQIKSNIREQLAQGKTREQIIQFYVERYGERILAAPPPAGINWALWLGPLAVLGIGGFILYRLILSFRRQGAAVPAEMPVTSPEERRYWEERIQAELEGRSPPVPDRKQARGP
ncbi:MAG: cytochrome c-type biogenesis protein CcmH [Chloroflexi bacterium]|nr:cytochrome c-type biogenesis protein CcmH [Chloroflexota bacterium]